MKCFLAANSAEGFISEFGNCYDPTKGWRAYIIKGGPGTGKSSFMRKVLNQEKVLDEDRVEVYCASDPDSLDGVIFPKRKTVIIDGTSPHTVEPRLPGIGDSILDFGAFWNEARLTENRDKILSLTKENKALHGGATRYIKAAGEVLAEHIARSERNLNHNKASRRREDIVGSFIPEKEGFGRVKNAFLSGITPKGILSFEEEISVENRIEIGDVFGAESEQILRGLRDRAVERGYKTVVFKNCILPSFLTDGIYIPELSLLVYKKHKIAEDALIDELIFRGAENIKAAKEIHDELEGYYISAMDFEALNKYTDDFIDERF